MDEIELNEKYGHRLVAILGPDYRTHRAYPEIVRQAKEGRRTMWNIFADYEKAEIIIYPVDRW